MDKDEDKKDEAGNREDEQPDSGLEVDARDEMTDADLTPELSIENIEEVAEEAAKATREILTHFPRVESPAVTWRLEDGSIWVDIEGDPSGRLIGRRGQTIEAFQHIISKIMSHRLRKRITVHVDAEHYRERHLEKLRKLAIQTADYVASTGNAMALEPMSPADRRIVHITLKDREDIMTMSEGKDQNRFVVIWPAEETRE